jgi:hypothetical protein
VSNTWSTPQTQGDAPSAREGHSAAAIGKCIFVFGGCGSHECYFNDVHILDTCKLQLLLQWCAVRASWFVHRIPLICCLVSATMTWCKAATSGNHPAPRDSHSMSSWNTKLIVLGGEDASNTFLCDIYILDSGKLVVHFVEPSLLLQNLLQKEQVWVKFMFPVFVHCTWGPKPGIKIDWQW